MSNYCATCGMALESVVIGYDPATGAAQQQGVCRNASCAVGCGNTKGHSERWLDHVRGRHVCRWCGVKLACYTSVFD